MMSITMYVLRFISTTCPPITTCSHPRGGGGKRCSISSGHGRIFFLSPGSRVRARATAFPVPAEVGPASPAREADDRPDRGRDTSHAWSRDRDRCRSGGDPDRRHHHGRARGRDPVRQRALRPSTQWPTAAVLTSIALPAYVSSLGVA